MPSEFPKPVAPGQPLLCLVTPPVLEEGQPGRSLFLSPLLCPTPPRNGEGPWPWALLLVCPRLGLRPLHPDAQGHPPLPPTPLIHA